MHTDRSRMPIWHSNWKERRRKMHKLYWAEVWNRKNLENEKGRSYTSSSRGIRNSNKVLEKWIEKLDLDLTIEALQKPRLLGTARIIRKVLDIKWKEFKKWKKKKATIPKTTGWCPLLWHFLPGNNIRPESKEIMIIMIIIIIKK